MQQRNKHKKKHNTSQINSKSKTTFIQNMHLTGPAIDDRQLTKQANKTKQQRQKGDEAREQLERYTKEFEEDRQL